MSRSILPKVTLCALMFVAFGLGLVSARPAYAANEISVKVHGGTSAGTADVSCGWHGACTSPPSAGNALDWSQNGGVGVYFHSYAYYSGSPPPANAGHIEAMANDGNCKNVTVNVFRYNGNPLGSLQYTHSEIYSTFPWTVFVAPLPESTWWPDADTSRRVATTASSELNGTCVNRGGGDPDLWTAPHLHQYADSPWGTNWGQFVYAPNTDANVDVLSISNFMHYVTYQY